MNTEQMIEVMQAFARGEKIEAKFRTTVDYWEQTNAPCWDWHSCEYRIAKPEPKKVKLVAFIDDRGYVRFVKEEMFVERKPPFTRVPILDIEVNSHELSRTI